MKITAYLVFLALSVFFISCNESVDKEVDTKDVFESKDDLENLPFDVRVKREAEGKIGIPANENYSLSVHKAHLNADNQEDAIVLVNRLQLAIDEAAKSNNAAKMAELGYMGNYNYFIYYDGKLNKFSNPITVASSPEAKLKVIFENIQSEVYKDVSIEYRIRNSAFRNYYLIKDGVLQIMFQWKLFDYIGTASPEANFISFEKGTMSSFKDIVVHEGKIKDYSPNVSNTYSYEPIIEKTPIQLHRFFFDPKTLKYYTKK